MDKFIIRHNLFQLDCYYFNRCPKDLSKVITDKIKIDCTPNTIYFKPSFGLLNEGVTFSLNQYEVTHLLDKEKTHFSNLVSPQKNDNYCLMIMRRTPYRKVKFHIPEDIDIREIELYGYTEKSNLLFNDDIWGYRFSKFIDPTIIKIRDEYYRGVFYDKKNSKILNFIYFCNLDDNKDIESIEGYVLEGNKYVKYKK